MNDYINYLGEQLTDHPEAVDATCTLAEAYAGSEDCPECDGSGVLVTRHRMWGHINCPEPTEEEECGWCNGTGLKDGGR